MYVKCVAITVYVMALILGTVAVSCVALYFWRGTRMTVDRGGEEVR